MTPKTFIQVAVFFVFAFATFTYLHAGDMAPVEKAKIEALITHLETLKDATFVRNGSDYDSKTAAKFIRGKWQAHEAEIKTATDFIAKAASSSSTTGKPYLIRLKSGPETPCADYLTAQLKKLEDAAKAK